jgi:hypothetical protein
LFAARPIAAVTATPKQPIQMDVAASAAMNFRLRTKAERNRLMIGF